MATAPSRIRYEIISATVGDLIDQYKSGELAIPPHQRQALSWPPRNKEWFIASVQEGIPTNGILQRVWDGKTYLEDGLQRLSTLDEYFNDSFTPSERGPDGKVRGPGKKFSELPDATKNLMKNYVLAVTRYRNATAVQAIRTFSGAQNGIPLSVGNRMWALKFYPSPLVDYAYRTLLTPGSGLYERSSALWGPHATMDKKYTTLVNAVTLVSGLVFGRMTQKWAEIEEERLLYKELDGTEAAITRNIEWVLSIHEEVNRRCGQPAKKEMTAVWKVSNINAYIAWSLFRFPADRQRLFAGWTDWLARLRVNPDLLKGELHLDVTGARSWNDERWRAGYMRVFEPAEAARLWGAVPRPLVDDEEDDEDSDV